jgi:TRAP-type C4-dicarboxylate transport system permease small subunit
MAASDGQAEAPGGVSPPEPAWVPTFPLIRKIDAYWAMGERGLCAVLFLAMAVLVFAAVITETFGTRRSWGDVVVLFGVCLLAVRTRAVKDGETRKSWPVSLGIAAGIAAAIAAGVWFYVERLPGGLPWAQKLSLVMMFWVALLGASLAAHERAHLALELGEKLWPKKLLPFVKAAAHGLTAAFCAFGMVVSWHIVQLDTSTIAANDWLSRSTAFIVLPYMFLAMAVRFLAQAVTTATGTEAPMEDRLPT